MVNSRMDDRLRNCGSSGNSLVAAEPTPADGLEFEAPAASAYRLVPGWLWELIGYGLVSAAALAADAAILRFLVVSAHWHYIPASALAFASGAAIAYVLSIRFVFRAHRVANRLLEFGLFLALGVVGLLVNTLTISLAFGLLGLGLLTSKLLAACGTFTTNFVLRRWLLFSSHGGSRWKR